MKPFILPNVDDFAAMSLDDRIASILPVAEYQAYRIAKGIGIYVDDYKSAAAVGLLDFCKTFQREKYQDNSHFTSVIMRIARNTIIDERRRLLGRFQRGKWRGLNLVDVNERRAEFVTTIEEDLPDSGGTPAQTLERAELPDRAESLLARLGERARKVVRMVYYEGKSQVEVSKIIGCTESNVSLIVIRAIRKMRKAAALLSSQ